MVTKRFSEVSQFSKPHVCIVIVALAIVIPILTPCPSEALRKMPFSQHPTLIVISEAHQISLMRSVEALRSSMSHGLNAEIERILLESLSAEYHTGCRDMISQWGTMAEGTADLSVQVLFINEAEHHDARQVLLVYRCSSTAEGYRDQFYDERLAALLITPTTSSLLLLPYLDPCIDCPDLSHIRFDQVVQDDVPTVVSLLIMTSSDNPCCDGPVQSHEERLNYYRVHETGITLVASIVRHREESIHDDVEGDTSTTYDATITVSTDQHGTVTQINAYYSLKTDGTLQQAGKDTYLWNRDTQEFEPIVH